MRHLFLAVLCTFLFASLATAAPTLFLKDGTKETGSSIWLESDKVYLSRSGELFEFGRGEVQLEETMRFNQIGSYQSVTTPGDHTIAPPPPKKIRRPHRPAKAAAEADTEKPIAAPAAAAKPAPAVAAATAVTPPATPAPAPAAKVTTPPAAAQPAPADAAAPPDKAELERRKQEVAAMMTEAITKKDPELLKKAAEMQKDLAAVQRSAKLAAGGQQPGGGFPMALVLLVLVVSILIIVANWIIFERAGQAGWKCLIPIYNMYILMVVAGKPWWWFLLLFIPLVGAAIYLLAMLSLAKRFGRSELFGVGIFLLPMIFLPLLAFSDSQFQGQPAGAY